MTSWLISNFYEVPFQTFFCWLDKVPPKRHPLSNIQPSQAAQTDHNSIFGGTKITHLIFSCEKTIWNNVLADDVI